MLYTSEQKHQITILITILRVLEGSVIVFGVYGGGGGCWIDHSNLSTKYGEKKDYMVTVKWL